MLADIDFRLVTELHALAAREAYYAVLRASQARLLSADLTVPGRDRGVNRAMCRLYRGTDLNPGAILARLEK